MAGSLIRRLAGEIELRAPCLRAPCHIHQAVRQGRKGQSAHARLAYQRCAYFSDDYGRHADYRWLRRFHRGTIVLIPAGGNPAYADPNEFLVAAIHQETRRDAQEGRTLDIALPRNIPEDLVLAVSAWVVAPLVERGMSIEVDAHCPPASDGLRHPHIHGYVAQRELTEEGFGLKRREWNNFFLRGKGRHVTQRGESEGVVSVTWGSMGRACLRGPRP